MRKKNDYMSFEEYDSMIRGECFKIFSHITRGDGINGR